MFIFTVLSDSLFLTALSTYLQSSLLTSYPRVEYHPYGKTVVIFLFRAYHVAVYHALKVYSSFTSSQATLSYLFLTSLKESVYDQFVLDEQSLVWELFGIAVVSYAHLVSLALSSPTPSTL